MSETLVERRTFSEICSRSIIIFVNIHGSPADFSFICKRKDLHSPTALVQRSVSAVATAVMLFPCQLTSHKPSCFALCKALDGPS